MLLSFNITNGSDKDEFLKTDLGKVIKREGNKRQPRISKRNKGLSIPINKNEEEVEEEAKYERSKRTKFSVQIQQNKEAPLTFKKRVK